MHSDADDPLRALDREAPPSPPPGLEARVIHTLRSRGLLVRPRRRWGGAVAAVSAALVALAAWLLWPHPAGPAKPTFVLLLYEDASFAAGRPERDLVAEYAAWARSLDRRGALVMGEKLGETSHRLRGGNGRGGGPTVDRIQVTSDLGQLAGLFVIRADDEAAALAIARTCPHLRYGGSVVVRPVATS